ncbi:MAG: SH3 domain-containing protein [Anaerolineae bacterium]|nr:SH3 domain-containing protein [Anaerolineae bacterium]
MNAAYKKICVYQGGRGFKTLLFGVLVCAFALSSCLQRVDRAALSTEIAAEIYATLTASVPTQTPVPPPTPTSAIPDTPTPTPFVPPEASVRSAVLNVRQGPGTNFASVAQLQKGASLMIIGQYNACDWLKVQLIDGSNGWVKGGADYVELKQECALIPHGTFRPPHGTLIVDKRDKRGLGELVVDNNTSEDAVVLVADIRNNAFIAVYVYANDRYILSGIPAGKYPVYFMTGTDWDGDDRTFVRMTVQRRFIDLFDFLQGNRRNILLQSASEDPAISYNISGAFPPLK